MGMRNKALNILCTPCKALNKSNNMLPPPSFFNKLSHTIISFTYTHTHTSPLGLSLHYLLGMRITGDVYIYLVKCERGVMVAEERVKI